MREWAIGLGALSASAAVAFFIYNRSTSTTQNQVANLKAQDPLVIFKREFTAIAPRIPEVFKSLASEPTSIYAFLEEPFLQIFSRGGKRIRPILAVLVGRICGCSQEYIEMVGTTVEAIHNASLIIDDIEDDSKMRRDIVCIHQNPKYGIKRAINSANYFYFKPFKGMLQKVPKNKSQQILEIFLQEMTLSHMGQAEDIFCHHLPFHSPNQFMNQMLTEQEYVRLVICKTGSILNMLVRWLCCLGNTPSQMEASLIRVIQNFAICFQIRDDIINLKSTMGKGVRGEDLLERKITLMVIQTVRMKDRRFVQLFCKNKKQPQELEELIKIIETNGSATYAQNQCEKYGRNSIKALRELPKVQATLDLQQILEMLMKRNQ